MNVIHILAGPVIGAVIGYCTNYIAVRMLFRPLRPVCLFGRQLPFTPGIIPKGQKRLARAVGSALGSTLLTADDLKQAMLSESTKQELHTRFEHMLSEQESTELGVLCNAAASDYARGRTMLQEKLTDVLTARMADMHLGELASQQVLSTVQEKLSGSFLGSMLGGNMLQSFAEPIATAVDHYIDANGYALLYPQVGQAWDELEQKTVGDANALLTDAGLAPADIMLRVYEAVLSRYAETLVELVNPAQLVEQKIADMPPEELEALVLSVMKRELNALVALGAVIGFLLGLLNLLF